MDSDFKKRKKSGHEFRKEKKSKQLEESAKECCRITQFYAKPTEVSRPSTSTVPVISDEDQLKMNDTSKCDFTTQQCSTVDLGQSECSTQVVPRHLTTLEGSKELDYFVKPSQNDLPFFFKFHPVQPSEKNMPFNDIKPLFNIEHADKQMFKRQWLTYNYKKQQLFCFLCIAFSNGKSIFCSGFDDWKHVHQRVQEHENSKSHIDCVRSFLMIKSKKSVHDLMLSCQLTKRKQEVKERRRIVEIVVDVLKLIGKQGLPYRGSLESAYTLGNENINHGNFLEIILLLKKYDPILQKHIDSIQKQSSVIHEKQELKKKECGSKAVGRGSLVTFLGKNTLGKVINILVSEMRRYISEEIKSACKYSVMMDTTIDISSNDQCSFVLRYVKDCDIVERLVALKCVQSTTGQGLFSTLKHVLEDLNLPLENCIANVFDGASNMSGQYKGLTAKLSEEIPPHLHTWCYAHVLNLVLCDTAQCHIATISFFNLLQEAQVFLKESLKRLQCFMDQKPDFKLESIGATRWKSRSGATTKIFGRVNDWIDIQPSDTERKLPKLVYLDLVVALFKISESAEFNSKVRHDASGLLSKFLSFETILVAMMFLQIFKSTTPLSDYLQTKTLDYVQAWHSVEFSSSQLKYLRDEFATTLQAAKTFVSKMSSALIEKAEIDNSLESISIETELKSKRSRTVKKMAGELARHAEVGAGQGAEETFRITVYYCVMDKINQAMQSRFGQHKTLYLDLSWFDPRRFNTVKTIPSFTFDRICEIVPSIDKGKLTEEYLSFSQMWPQISNRSVARGYLDFDILSNHYDDVIFEECEEDPLVQCNREKECNACIKCVFKVLIDYSMYSLQYTELFKVYKHLLTIPMTQVSCERVFSKLKMIKTRLRSTMTNENLEAFMMMAVEKDILNKVESETVIEKLCISSTELKRLLSY